MLSVFCLTHFIEERRSDILCTAVPVIRVVGQNDYGCTFVFVDHDSGGIMTGAAGLTENPVSWRNVPEVSGLKLGVHFIKRVTGPVEKRSRFIQEQSDISDQIRNIGGQTQSAQVGVVVIPLPAVIDRPAHRNIRVVEVERILDEQGKDAVIIHVISLGDQCGQNGNTKIRVTVQIRSTVFQDKPVHGGDNISAADTAERVSGPETASARVLRADFPQSDPKARTGRLLSDAQNLRTPALHSIWEALYRYG